jgi:hypothetical protein
MKLYFENVEQLDQFTKSLPLNREQVKCVNCGDRHQFVSHAFVHKKLNKGETITVGKRLFCSNRRQYTGCGATLRLYLAVQIPTLVYSTVQMTIFLNALLAYNSIQRAYKAATNTDDPRNAYRWLIKLKLKLVDYRSFLKKPSVPSMPTTKLTTRRLQVLLPIIQSIFLKYKDNPFSQYQHNFI